MRQFGIVAWLTHRVPDDIREWPANIQDKMYAAIEAKEKELGFKLVILSTRCDFDLAEDKWFVHIDAVQQMGSIQ